MIVNVGFMSTAAVMTIGSVRLDDAGSRFYSNSSRSLSLPLPLSPSLQKKETQHNIKEKSSLSSGTALSSTFCITSRSKKRFRFFYP